MKPNFHSVAPMLAVKDAKATAVYYQDCLGFSIEFIAESDCLPTYAVLERDGFEIHLLEVLNLDSTASSNGINVTVDNVDLLFEEFQNAKAFDSGFPRHLDSIREHPPENKEYGMRDFIFVDPNGYIIVIGQPLE